MPPPKLPRDAPVVDVPHPFEVVLLILLGREADMPFFNRGNRLIGERLDPDEPLRRQPRLNNVARALTASNRVGVLLDRNQLAARFEIGNDLFARLEAIEPRIHTGRRIQMCRLVHHVDLRQIVALAQCKVIGVMRRRNLYCAGSKVAAHPGVRHDGNDPPSHRLHHLHQVVFRVALVLGMNGHGDITRHRLRPCRRDRDGVAGQRTARAHHVVADDIKLALLLFVDDLHI